MNKLEKYLENKSLNEEHRWQGLPAVKPRLKKLVLKVGTATMWNIDNTYVFILDLMEGVNIQSSVIEKVRKIFVDNLKNIPSEKEWKNYE